MALARSGEIRRLSDRGLARIVPESEFAQHRGNALDELLVHVAGNSGNESAGNVADRTGGYSRAVLLETCAPPQTGSTHFQRRPGYGFQRGGLRVLLFRDQPHSSCTRPAGSSGRGNHTLRMQYDGDVHHYRPDGEQSDLEGLERKLSLVVSLLSSGSGHCGPGEFFECAHRLAAFPSCATADLLDVSVLSLISGQARSGKTACRKSFHPALANHRSAGS